MVRDTFAVVVHVMLLRDVRVWLLRRAATGFMDGLHALPGGYIMAGETPLEAARRECFEEAGIVIAPRPRCVLPYLSAAGQGFNFVFDADVFEGEPFVNEPDLFDAGGWYPLAALPDPVVPWLGVAVRMGGNDWYREFGGGSP
jgi:8-oxo-dGTP pyrophosphatase MutT (NUDIX family)